MSINIITSTGAMTSSVKDFDDHIRVKLEYPSQIFLDRKGKKMVAKLTYTIYNIGRVSLSDVTAGIFVDDHNDYSDDSVRYVHPAISRISTGQFDDRVLISHGTIAPNRNVRKTFYMEIQYLRDVDAAYEPPNRYDVDLAVIPTYKISYQEAYEQEKALKIPVINLQS
ncbi:hypothetical protein [Okeania sp. KiyG1]|uniref:hypothetical protein n=1 Tax=Okeania sp. KiyG1 TaxID=2720165 RepID=UPI001921D683|nr:hypothetical protein [Okeania sp. KiyG1]GGA54839.1 hypothetical protein CYANOKiyG1_75310 [Okeania sp. KiyG1]